MVEGAVVGILRDHTLRKSSRTTGVDHRELFSNRLQRWGWGQINWVEPSQVKPNPFQSGQTGSAPVTYCQEDYNIQDGRSLWKSAYLRVFTRGKQETRGRNGWEKRQEDSRQNVVIGELNFTQVAPSFHFIFTKYIASLPLSLILFLISLSSLSIGASWERCA